LKDAYYFSHDSNARHDIKIKAMVNQYGMAGYGLYWVIIEMLRDTSDYELPLKKYFYQALSAEAQMQPDEAEQWLRDCIDIYELFDESDDVFYSRSLKNRMQIKDDKRKKRSDAGKKGMLNRWSNSNEEQTDSDVITIDNNVITMDNKESKGKDNKGKDNKEKQTTTKIKSVVVADESNIFYQFQSLGFGNITPYFKLQLEELESKYSAQWLIEAMQKSVNQGFYTVSYVKGILQSWKSKGKDAPKPQYIKGKIVDKGFDERQYKKEDFDDLEKKLLGWEK